MDAIRFRHTDVVRMLKKGGAHLTQEEQAQVSVKLCKAASSGDVQMAQMLIECGADVNASWQDERTPLHLASFYGHLPIVQMIIESISSSNRVITNGTPSKMTDKRTSLSIENLQISGMGRSSPTPSPIMTLEPLDAFGNTPLMCAQRNNHPAIVNVLKGALNEVLVA
jgi:ankyrin repeat protein